MQKYVLVKLLAQVPEGTDFSMQEWPLHVTISPCFAVDLESTKITEKLSKLLDQQKPIKAVAGEDEYFGANGQVHVTLIEMTKELQALHDNIMSVLAEAGAVFDEIQYTGKNYRAHATVQNSGRLHKRDVVMIDDVTFIDMYPEQDIKQRKIMNTIAFGG